MWLLSAYRSLILKSNQFKYDVIFYSKNFEFILSPWYLKRSKTFFYVDKRACKPIKSFTFETKNIRFRYAGKAYRISKKNRILFLTLHYPTFKYVIWRNIKLYYKRKRKKLYKFKLNTISNYKSNFFYNMLKLRVPDTYTKRGIINNIFVFNFRKRKVASRR